MIVVMGARGNVGQPLVRALAAAGALVTAVSRSIASPDVPGNVRHHQADLTVPESLKPAFDGAEMLFMHDGGVLGRAVDPHRVVSIAEASGIRRIVLLSSQGVATRPDSESHGILVRLNEDAVRSAGLEWTILRPGGFNSNAYAWAESVRTRRTVAAPFGDVGLPTIDPADIAEVAAATLLHSGHEGRIYELTGPALVTPRQRAAAIGAALGEPIRFVEQTRDEARAQMARFMPDVVADTTLAILGQPTDAELRISPDVERVIGRPPRTFGDWATRNVAAFR